jgi:hypothetical protein
VRTLVYLSNDGVLPISKPTIWLFSRVLTDRGTSKKGRDCYFEPLRLGWGSDQ